MSKLERMYSTGFILIGKSSSTTLWFCFLSFNPFHEVMGTEKYKES